MSDYYDDEKPLPSTASAIAAKQKERDAIANHIDAFLASGGKIMQFGPTDSVDIKSAYNGLKPERSDEAALELARHIAITIGRHKLPRKALSRTEMCRRYVIDEVQLTRAYGFYKIIPYPIQTPEGVRWTVEQVKELEINLTRMVSGSNKEKQK